MSYESATASVIRAGRARGFIVGADDARYIITAAHCLPELPSAHPRSAIEERCHPELLVGTLHQDPTLRAECLFADPIADIAVLGAVDEQELPEACDAYMEFMDGMPCLQVRTMVENEPAWLLSLDGAWFGVKVRGNRMMWTCDVASGSPIVCESSGSPIMRGMSGSPILGDDGKAIGVVSSGPHACLSANLPVWAWEKLSTR